MKEILLNEKVKTKCFFYAYIPKQNYYILKILEKKLFLTCFLKKRTCCNFQITCFSNICDFLINYSSNSSNIQESIKKLYLNGERNTIHNIFNIEEKIKSSQKIFNEKIKLSKYGIIIIKRKTGIINFKKKDVCILKYDIVFSFKDEFAVATKGKYFGIINKEGEEVCPFKYDYVYDFYNKFAIVQLNGKYGFINKEGKEICPIKYDYVYNFVNGFAVVILNNKYGFINEKGEEICPIKYDYVYQFHNGEAIVILNQQLKTIDTKGNEI